MKTIEEIYAELKVIVSNMHINKPKTIKKKQYASEDEWRAAQRMEARVRRIKNPPKKQLPPSRDRRIAQSEVARRKRLGLLPPERCYVCLSWDRPTINHIRYLPPGRGLDIVWMCSLHTARYKAARFCLYDPTCTRSTNIANNSPMIKGMFVIDGEIR